MMNATQSPEHVWCGLRLVTRRTTGKVGKARSGVKVHILVVEEVVGLADDDGRPNFYRAEYLRRQARGDRRPVIVSAHGLCNGNGQHVGLEVPGAIVTCGKCLAACPLPVHLGGSWSVDRISVCGEAGNVTPSRSLATCLACLAGAEVPNLQPFTAGMFGDGISQLVLARRAS